MENKLDRNDLIYKIGNKKKDKTYDFQKFKVITSFGREILNNDLSLDDAFEQQIKSKDDIDNFKGPKKPKESVKKKKKKTLTLRNAIVMEAKKFLMLLKVKYFQKENKEKDLKSF